MKNWILSLAILISGTVLLSTVEADGGNSQEARINTYKNECKQLTKPFRYEGSRVTYYAVQKEAIKRSVEAYMILDTEYKFAISGKEASTKVSAKFFDVADEKKRTLLKEVKSVNNKNTVVSSKDLSDVFRKKVSSSERLKSVYIEYTIAGGTQKNDALVMVVAYKD